MPIRYPTLDYCKTQAGDRIRPATSHELDLLRKQNVSGNSLEYFATYNLLMEKRCFRFWDAAHVIEMMGNLHPNCDVWRQGFAAFASDLEGRAYCFDQNSLDSHGDARIVRLQYTFDPTASVADISKVAVPIANHVEEFVLMYAQNRIPGWDDRPASAPPPLPQKLPAVPPPLPTSTPKPASEESNPALLVLVQPDEALARIVGSSPVPRGELTQRFWDYVKRNNLQDAVDPAQINTDDALKAVFDGEDAVSMFEVTLGLQKHLKRL